MKVLVTGGTGFIGGHLVKELVKSGAWVIVIDIAINPKSIFALEKLDKKTRFEFLDIRNKKKVFELFRVHEPSYIFHLAADPIVASAYNNPYNAFETNIMGTVNILEASRSVNSIQGIIVASSDKAYGKTDKVYTEESPLRADHPYDVSKASADLISQAYFMTYGLPVVITRFGNVYGEGDFHFGRIMPDIFESVIKKKILKVRSNGKYIRDYIYVKDVVSGYMLLFKKIDSVHGEAYNFSSQDTLSVLEVVQKVEKILKVKIPYEILNTAQNEIPYQHLDDSKIRKLGWAPKYNLYNSLKRVLLWYKKIFKKDCRYEG